MGKTAKMQETFAWTIAMSDFDRMDVDRDNRLSTGELVPSFKEQILPTLKKFAILQLPPDCEIKSEEVQKSVDILATGVAKMYAKRAHLLMDSNMDGYLSREEVAALADKSFQFQYTLDFTVNIKGCNPK